MPFPLLNGEGKSINGSDDWVRPRPGDPRFDFATNRSQASSYGYVPVHWPA